MVPAGKTRVNHACECGGMFCSSVNAYVTLDGGESASDSSHSPPPTRLHAAAPRGLRTSSESRWSGSVTLTFNTAMPCGQSGPSTLHSTRSASRPVAASIPEKARSWRR